MYFFGLKWATIYFQTSYDGLHFSGGLGNFVGYKYPEVLSSKNEPDNEVSLHMFAKCWSPSQDSSDVYSLWGVHWEVVVYKQIYPMPRSWLEMN